MTSSATGMVLRERDQDRAAARRRLRPWLASLLMLVPVVAELVVGGYQIGGPSLWRDEGDTLSASTRPVGDIWALTQNQDAVHGAYYLLMHYVLAVAGTSATALRLPSLLATAAAAGLTAVLGRRLAAAAGLPAPGVTGMAAGLMLVAMPRTTWYAQDARPYAIATLLAVAATYLLVRAWAAGAAGDAGDAGDAGAAGDDGRSRSRWRWWAGYWLVMLALAAMNLLALLLLVSHAVTLLLARRKPAPRAWLWFGATAAATLACVVPLATLAGRQSQQIAWLTRPGVGAVLGLIADFSGVKALVPVVFGVAVLCVAMEAANWRQPGLTVAKVALPWLVLPPAILIGVSEVHTPVLYDERYVLFCSPAMALLTAGGLAWLAKMLLPAVGKARWLAIGTPVLLAAVVAGIVVVPQQQVRLTAARPDDLAAVAALLTARERPGDAVLFVPWPSKAISQAYPAPFAGLRDIALRESPQASATLRGLTVSAPVLEQRFKTVTRVWVLSLSGTGPGFTDSPLGRAESRLLSRMQLAGLWTIKTVKVRLYVRG